MVGAKQFAIRRKINPVNRANPLLKAISMPTFMKDHYTELNNDFTDNNTLSSGLLSKFARKMQQVTKEAISNHKEVISNHKEEDTNKDQVISDKLADLITCKVLKNIKNYLNPQREAAPNRHIKLEISL